MQQFDSTPLHYPGLERPASMVGWPFPFVVGVPNGMSAQVGVTGLENRTV